MNFRNLILNIAIGAAAFFFGLAWIDVYDYFLARETKNDAVEQKPVDKIDFNINDPDSLLPIDYEEDKLTSPKVDENNEALFDPEGYYFILGDLPLGFEDFDVFAIDNKKFGINTNRERYMNFKAPSGFVETDKQYEFSTISIGKGKIHFHTAGINGVSYEFDGEFLVKGNFYTLDPEEKVLKGTFTKKKYNAVVAISEVTFGWFLEYVCTL